MQTENTFSLSEKNEADIRLFCKVASENGSTVSLKEILFLTSLDATERELELALQNSSLSEEYDVYLGSVKQKGVLSFEDIQTQTEDRRVRAESNIDYAKRFARLLRGPRVLSISGSTSYRSVSKDDDLDFFCIARKDTMWIFLSKALLLARAFRASSKDSPWICLSYVMDEDYALREFTSPKDGLFARDALSTIVLRGEHLYNRILLKSSWMKFFFPKMYSHRTRDTEDDSRTVGKGTTSPAERIFNLFLYRIVGNYIGLKSYLLNRKFAKENSQSRSFVLKIGKDHCIYESLSYLRLRRIYSGFERKPSS
jgi:hypothetical protein